MELVVYPSDLGLPSMNADCLQFMAAAKFCAAPISIVHSSRPWSSKTGKLPVLYRTDGGAPISNFDTFAEYLKSHAADVVLDGHLTPAQKSDAYVYARSISARLRPAYHSYLTHGYTQLYTLWVDECNFNYITNRWHMKNLNFPWNLSHVSKMRSSVMQTLRELYPGEHVTWRDIEYAVMKMAVLCANDLSTKLGDKKYFYGNKPSTLDAIAFGYCAPLLKLPLPSDKLNVHVKASPNLCRLVESVLSVYMPICEEEMHRQRLEASEWEYQRSIGSQHLLRLKRAQDMRQEEMGQQGRKGSGSRTRSQTSGANPDSDNEFGTTDKVLFGIAAAVLSVLAALHFGIVKVEFEDNSSQNSKNETDQLLAAAADQEFDEYVIE